MSQKRVCAALQAAEGAYLSGEELSRSIGITRAAVWKAVEALRRQGYDIEARTGRGYRLRQSPDLLRRETVEAYLSAPRADWEVLESVDSTNSACRRLALEGAEDGTVVMADCQTAGRGRRNRSFQSPAGRGLFLSILWRPGCTPDKLLPLTALSAVAVYRAVERVCGVNLRIKWPNDIVAGGRKVCGMLMEMDATPEKVASVVAGVGINVHQTQFPEEIAHSASSLDLLAGRRISRADIVRAFLQEYERVWALGDEAMMRAYRERSATIGQRVQVIGLNGTYTGTAQDVTESGSLLVRADEDGGVREVLAADVSVRGIMGYA